ADGKGRAAALEVMIVTSTIRDLIRDRNRVGEVRDYIAEGRDQYGMQTFDQHLMDLVDEGTVTFETARAAASNPADFELQLRTLRRRSRTATKVEAAAATGDQPPSGFNDGMSGLMPQ
ncbi:MAG TPA: hypothetical protein VD793_02480, partial [Gemmatimonadales bacterium]|nr:hypothetical protein [Gemmatimonadales bacterium]